MDDLVTAALAAARERGQDVSQVPLTAVAAAAGISRSTLLRRLGGTRTALDAALRAAGHDAGARLPVRERAVEAAGRLLAERGLGGFTLEAVAAEAGCSLPSLHTVFQGRDGLLAALFERYSPLPEVEALAADPPATLEEKIRGLYRALLAAFGREVPLMRALMADLLARPDGPAVRVFELVAPRMLAGVGALLEPEIAAGRLRAMPLPLLVQQLIGPLLMHLLMSPALARPESEVRRGSGARPGSEVRRGSGARPGSEARPRWTSSPDGIEETCEIFAESFLRATRP
ncbi:TetR family transcriptional regulator [Nonomuraea sp. NPDC050663]|uniref:TetR family transcriptional regulator n=1 Tax=Nonomuraea sp. NPDC050663 TaxID=3364370 RepID=UPI0037B9FF0E